MSLAEADLLDKPGAVTEAMREGLARAYAIPGFREYLVFATRAANRNAMTCIQAGKPEEAKTFALRMGIMEKMLEQAKQCYTQYDQVRKQRRKLSTGATTT